MIDWDFIASLEGGRLSGYVPDAEGSSSGVTVACGIDLGQMGDAVFDALPIGLQALLRPYIGLRRQDAVAALADRALIITQAQADTLNAAVRAPLLSALSERYERDAGVPFFVVIDAAQTVCASVTWQYGAPWVRCPKFWHAATRQDWPGVVGELSGFGDSYPARHRKEANYLAAALGLPVEGV